LETISDGLINDGWGIRAALLGAVAGLGKEGADRWERYDYLKIMIA
jgi:hypothetical protein